MPALAQAHTRSLLDIPSGLCFAGQAVRVLRETLNEPAGARVIDARTSRRRGACHLCTLQDTYSRYAILWDVTSARNSRAALARVPLASSWPRAI